MGRNPRSRTAGPRAATRSFTPPDGAVDGFVNMVAGFNVAWEAQPRRSVTFAEFRQVVRRFRPSALLPELARLSVLLEEVSHGDPLYRTSPPWAMALAVREAILYGNEHRIDALRDEDLRVLFNTHNDIHEDDANPKDFDPLKLLVRVAYEQFPYQESLFEEVSRTHALMVEGADRVPGLQVLDDNAWDQLLGAPLGLMVGATFFLQVAANQNNGWYDPKWLDQPDFAPVLEHWPREVLELRAEQLSNTVEEFRADYQQAPKPEPGFERYAYNPLVARPFIKMSDGRLLAPQPRLILRTISPDGLYYRGMAAFDKPFGADMGRLTEQYVGRQLKLFGVHADIHPEVVYGKEQKRSVDWFAVLPNVVLMVESKSARFGLLERSASPGFEKSVTDRLNFAAGQLVRTSHALDADLPEFVHIPRDRKRIGIIVTSEPHYLVNSPWMRERILQPEFPTLVASLRDLEHVMSLPPETIEERLLDIVSDPDRSTWSLDTALGANVGARNPILDAAWESYPWLVESDDEQSG